MANVIFSCPLRIPNDQPVGLNGGAYSTNRITQSIRRRNTLRYCALPAFLGPLRNRWEGLDVLAPACLRDRPARLLFGDAHRKRQALRELDLGQEQRDRLARREADLPEHRLGLALELWLDPGADGLRLAHVRLACCSCVAHLGYEGKARRAE